VSPRYYSRLLIIVTRTSSCKQSCIIALYVRRCIFSPTRRIRSA